MRIILQIPGTAEVQFERFSDSAGEYVVLDSNNPAIYKQLYRAAKAKLKLRLKVTVRYQKEQKEAPIVQENPTPESNKRSTYLETVLSKPQSDVTYFQPFEALISDKPTQSAKEQDAVQSTLSRPTLPTLHDFCTSSFSIDCNNCGHSVINEHYHCSKCDKGDFDLCPDCVERGIICRDDDHWLIKRSIKNGKVLSSNTETLPPKKLAELIPEPKPEPMLELKQELKSEPLIEEDQRTCNSCIIRKSLAPRRTRYGTNCTELGASAFVTCQQCPDFDLCFICLEHAEHGHHPAHTFAPVDPDAVANVRLIRSLCEQEHGLKHEAVCDRCDVQIVGVRYKCLACPDFDYCSACFQNADEDHPGHRFAPIYEQLKMLNAKKEQHRGIYCDGPICASRARKSYIRGDRYKCAICRDTDFCANCEALPNNPHNKTHPLIKLRTPVRQLSIATINEQANGGAATVLGDLPAARNASTGTSRTVSANAATRVQTVAEVKPSEPLKDEATEQTKASSFGGLQAWFVTESTPDGSSFAPNRLISQSWTLRNPGPLAWPAGCAVHFIGGDEMRNLDDKHPSSTDSMILANRSNVLDKPLEPGKTAVFTVLLKSPSRKGRAISYWRLKTAEGLSFGHKLWIDINITSKECKPVEAPAVVPVEAPSERDVNVEAEEKSQGSSTMIFPTLEKESPETSIENLKDEPVHAEPAAATEDQDLLDDLESMTLEDGNTEDGFMTDEEYDILDAEDEEYLMNAHQASGSKK